MARTIAVANHKGGVGKTTTAISLGAALAEKGQRVLLVDLDPQQNLYSSLRAPNHKPGLADVLSAAVLLETADLSDAFVDVWGMTVVGGYDLASVEDYLSYYQDSEKVLRWVLTPQSHRFDFVLLDCGPTISFFTVSALAAADELLVPIQTEFLALNQLPAIMSTVQDIRRRLNPCLEIAGFIPTMFEGRTRHALEIIEQINALASRFGVRAFKPIPKTVRMAEAAAAGRPISQYAPKSPASLAYEALSAEFDRQYGVREEDVHIDVLSRLAGSFVRETVYAAAPCS